MVTQLSIGNCLIIKIIGVVNLGQEPDSNNICDLVHAKLFALLKVEMYSQCLAPGGNQPPKIMTTPLDLDPQIMT